MSGQLQITLVPKTNLCNEISNAVLATMNVEINNLRAIDTLDTIVIIVRDTVGTVQHAYGFMVWIGRPSIYTST